MKTLLLYIKLTLIICSISIYCSAQKSGIALLKLPADTVTSFEFSADHILKVAGVPYIITDDLNVALQYKIIMSVQDFSNGEFTSDQKVLLTNFVSSGGVWVVPRMLASSFYSVFGIQSYTSQFTNETVLWNTDLNDQTLRWIDDDFEKVISIGDVNQTTPPNAIKTHSYLTNPTATILATFPDDGKAAVIKNQYGQGFAYTIGFSWKDLILTNQIGKSINAFRSYSNAFEPTSDVIILFIRAIYQTHAQAPVWKYTAPYQNKSVLMITHDVDSNTGMDTMNYFSDREQELGITTTYNITTKRFRDAMGRSYYNSRTIPLIKLVMQKGQSIGNHSYGHFPDLENFNISNQIASANYLPYYNGNKTVGGSVINEIGVSDYLLRTDLGIIPRIWRSGFLDYPTNLMEMLDFFGYPYSTNLSANSILTNFPYHCKSEKKFTGKTLKVLEIPMTISDVITGISASNILEIAERWRVVLQKNTNNNAPTVLLIHPNRRYKLLGQDYLLSHLPEDVAVMEITKFGDYWRTREKFNFESNIQNEILIITVKNSSFPIDEQISLIVDNSSQFTDIQVITETGQAIATTINDRDENQKIISFASGNNPICSFISANEDIKNEVNTIKIFGKGIQPYILKYKVNEVEFTIKSITDTLSINVKQSDKFEIISLTDATFQKCLNLPSINNLVDENNKQISKDKIFKNGNKNEKIENFNKNLSKNNILILDNSTQEPTIFPNPFENEIIINCEKSTEIIAIEIIDNSGKIIYNIDKSKIDNSQRIIVNLSKIEKSGIYFAKVITKEKFWITKIVKL